MSSTVGRAAIPVRAVAARLLAAVRSGRSSLSDGIPEADARLADPRDRALLRLLIFETLRTIYRREAALQSLLENPLPATAREVEALLLLGLMQLDQGIDAPYAVVDASVEAARALGKSQYAKLVNAVLRSAQRAGSKLYDDALLRPECQYDHPRWLIERLQKDWPEEYPAILAAGNVRGPTWLRCNRLRQTSSDLCQSLQAAGVAARRHAILPDAIEAPDAGDVTCLPGWEQGNFSVQDVAAQLAVELLDLVPGLRVLDACTAPGGKLAHIAERAPDLDYLLGLDSDGRRLERTRDALKRLGLRPTLKQADAADTSAWWNGVAFDRILIDAPCSGTGVIRRHPDIRLLRRASDISGMVGQQSRLLDALWPLLRSGGRLVYATCSVLKDENQHQISAFLSRHPDARAGAIPALWFGQEAGAGRQNLPGNADADGFFYAVLEKSA